MSIFISNADATPHTITAGETAVVISFDGQASENGARVTVTFEISPKPPLSFRPANPSASFTFNQASGTFTHRLDILKSGIAPTLKNGRIRLSARKDTGETDEANTNIVFK